MWKVTQKYQWKQKFLFFSKGQKIKKETLLCPDAKK
jgi:hypothetical protein